MRSGGQSPVRRASVPETVGAWLRVWTPPRDVEVPPVPVRRLLAGAGVALVLAAVAAALLVPRIDAAKRRDADAAARVAAQHRAADRARIDRLQTPRHARVAALRLPASAPAAARLRARAGLVARAEAAITSDARARARAGELRGRPAGTACSPVHVGTPPQADLSARFGSYDCFVTTRAIGTTKTNIGGALGYPFRAVLDFPRAAITWCMVNQIPGERLVPDPRQVIGLPAACRIR